MEKNKFFIVDFISRLLWLSIDYVFIYFYIHTYFVLLMVVLWPTFWSKEIDDISICTLWTKYYRKGQVGGGEIPERLYQDNL